MSAGRYKALDKLVNATHLPVLVEQKQVQQHEDSAHHVDQFEPLTLTETFAQTFLVVNYINDGKSSILDTCMFGMVISTIGTFSFVTPSVLVQIELNNTRYNSYGSNGQLGMRLLMTFQLMMSVVT